MKDGEIVFTVVILIAAYYVLVLRRGRGLRGRMTTGYGGTVSGGASKMFTRHSNSNRRTNAQRGAVFSPAPIAWNGAVNGQAPAAFGGSRWQGWRGSQTTGPVGSFVANQWPTQRVTSTSLQRIGTDVTQVPSYTAVPLTVQGIGGGGTLVASDS